MAVDVVLLALRLRLVLYVTGDLLGQGCSYRTYDPAERSYLIAITGLSLLILVVTSIGLLALRSHRLARRFLIAAGVMVAVVLVYVGLVWSGGLELANKPVSEVDPCSSTI
ncbi:hypothetical protein [Mycobacterium sp. NPDC050441]|uniref:hypothetical protein n=1 Tax=Mycobacterium sp. NPDC050441 TaxID=3155403 RepID=UPI0033EF6376